MNDRKRRECCFSWFMTGRTHLIRMLRIFFLFFFSFVRPLPKREYNKAKLLDCKSFHHKSLVFARAIFCVGYCRCFSVLFFTTPEMDRFDDDDDIIADLLHRHFSLFFFFFFIFKENRSRNDVNYIKQEGTHAAES